MNEAEGKRTRDTIEASEPLFWIVLGLAGVFLCIGGLFLVRPDWGSRAYGIAAGDEAARAYVRAVAFRDIALASYMGGLTLLASRRAVAILLLITVLIPVGDLTLLWTYGALSVGHLLLHGASAAVFGLLGTVAFRSPPQTSQ